MRIRSGMKGFGAAFVLSLLIAASDEMTKKVKAEAALNSFIANHHMQVRMVKGGCYTA